MCIATPKVLNRYSKKNLEKIVHNLSFQELSFQLEEELPGEDDSVDAKIEKYDWNQSSKQQKTISSTQHQ